jgi:MFS family permease
MINLSLKKDNQVGSSIYIAIICFCTYACMYAFRKPFTIGLYADMPSFLGIEYKNLLVIAQVLGYTASKIFGIKFISELKNIGRGKLIFILIVLSWIPLLLFPILPAPINILCFFLNGFPLGIIWGIVFSFVEGRRATDFIGATLAVSFIVSSGVIKSIAKWLQLTYHISENWVPFYTGLVFILPIIVFIYLLEKIPAPTPEEIELKAPRLPMTKSDRLSFFKEFKIGIIAFIFIYLILTLFRDLRDNFAANIWNDLGYANNASVFTNTELPIALIVLVLIASMIIIKKNKLAFLISILIIIVGFVVVGVSTFLFKLNILNGYNWMLLVGLGLYMGYIPFNSLLFDRMIATFRIKGNVGFLIYLLDSFGYLASVIVISIKGSAHLQLNWAQFYAKGVLYFSVLGLLASLAAFVYYSKKIKILNY